MKIARRAALALAACALLVGVVRWAVRPRYDLGQGDLLRRATRVCAWPICAGDYVWLTDHEILRLVNDPRRPVELRLERANPETGATVLLPAFNTTFLRLTRGLQAYRVSLAPDGTALLLDTSLLPPLPGPPGGTRYLIRTSDGSVSVVPPSLLTPTFHWATRGHHGANLTPGPDGSGTLRLYDADGTALRLTRTVRLRTANASGPLVLTDVADVLGADRALVGAVRPAGGPTGILCDVDLRTGRATARTFDPRSGPSLGYIAARALSPGAARIVWCTKRRRVARPTIVDRIRERLGGRSFPDQEMELWTGDLTGTRRRSLGKLAVGGGEAPMGLEWMPDGRHVTFWLRGAVWRVDAGR